MSMEIGSLCEKASVTIDTQIEQDGIFCETLLGDQSTLTLIFQATVSAIVSSKPSFER